PSTGAIARRARPGNRAIFREFTQSTRLAVGQASMRHQIRIAIFLLLSAGCGGASPSAPSSPSSPAATSSLQGTIVSALDGQPLAGVTVKIGSHSAVSDAAGAYRLNDVAAGQSEILTGAS